MGSAGLGAQESRQQGSIAVGPAAGGQTQLQSNRGAAVARDILISGIGVSCGTTVTNPIGEAGFVLQFEHTVGQEGATGGSCRATGAVYDVCCRIGSGVLPDKTCPFCTFASKGMLMT